MKPKNALVLAGGNWQVPLIQFLKSKGDHIIVTDPYLTSAGVKYADYHIQEDVRDAKKILKAVSDQALRIDYAISDQSDIAIKSLAEINETLNLTGVKPDVAELFTNKYVMRTFAAGCGVPVPSFKKCYSTTDLLDFFELNGKKPVMLKPADSQSSRGIFLMNDSNIADAATFVESCFSATRLDYVICEQFIEGTELTAEGFCSGGKHITLALSRKKHFRTGIASDLIYPSDLPDSVNSKIKKYNDLFVNSSGLVFGITHAEYIYNKEEDEIYLVEIACRGGGTLISSDIIKWVSGVDVYELLYAGLNGHSTDLSNYVITNKSAILHFFEFPSGTVKNIEGTDEIERMPGVILFKLEFKIGDVINNATDDRSRQGFIILKAGNPDELNNRLSEVNHLLKVTVE